MKTNKIDKLDKQRYNALKLGAVGMVLLITPMIIVELLSRVSYPLIALGLAGIIILAISTYSLISVKLKIKANPALKEILFDEMYINHSYKAFRNGFWAMYGVLLFYVCTSSLYQISLLLASLIVIFAGFFTMLVSFLRLQKEKK